MSTGLELEENVFNLVHSMVQSGDLGLNSSLCKIFKKKGYYSRQRERDIITDVSIEIFAKNSDTPLIIWVWECKDYAGSIPVDDVEEFHAKLEQIGSDKTKGTIITSQGAFQRSAVSYASAMGIGLARILPDSQVQHVMYNMAFSMLSSREENDTIQALTRRKYVSHDWDFYGLSSDSKLIGSGGLSDYLTYEMKLLSKEIES